MGRGDTALLVVGLIVVALAASSGKPVARKLSRVELAKLARDVGFPDAEVEHAADIALRESGGNPSAVLDTRGRTDLPRGTLPEHSIGLWQINLLAWPEFSKAELLNAKGNARAALKIWKRAGWAPWSTHRPDE